MFGFSFPKNVKKHDNIANRCLVFGHASGMALWLAMSGVGLVHHLVQSEISQVLNRVLQYEIHYIHGAHRVNPIEF